MELGKTYVLYHGNCMDGFGAAYSAWNVLGDAAKYIAVYYKADATYDDIPDNIKGGDNQIYLVDFCYKAPIIKQLLEENNKIIILDHHVTAKNDIEVLQKDKTIPKDQLEIHFDMEKSGAGITWDYFHSSALPRPQLINYIEDSDLWDFDLPDSKKIRAYMQSVPYTFKDYAEAHKDMEDEVDFARVAYAGAILLRFQEKQVNQICEGATIIEGKDGPFALVNSNVYVSEVGDQLMRMYPQTKFSMSYRIETEGVTTFSLRSIKGSDVNVGEIAESFGGGGHKHAAGFVASEVTNKHVKSVVDKLME